MRRGNEVFAQHKALLLLLKAKIDTEAWPLPEEQGLYEFVLENDGIIYARPQAHTCGVPFASNQTNRYSDVAMGSKLADGSEPVGPMLESLR